MFYLKKAIKQKNPAKQQDHYIFIKKYQCCSAEGFSSPEVVTSGDFSVFVLSDLGVSALCSSCKTSVCLAERLSSIIENIEGVHIPIGVLDITLYRDDLAHMSYQPLIQETHIDEDITNKTLVLVDDVLYTGRTIRAALDALIDLGRPKKIQLAVLIDRGHRELPIRADYVGKNVPTATKEAIAVKLTDTDDCDKVFIGEYI